MTNQEFLQKIVGYLPYKIKAITTKKGYMQSFEDKVSIIETLSVKDNDCVLISEIDQGYYLCSIDEIKPFLRPLSDLTKEIRHDKDEFMPMDKLGEMFHISELEYTQIYQNLNGKEHDWPVYYLRYNLIQKLYEWHFDIHGLISQGLAIDINTLEL